MAISKRSRAARRGWSQRGKLIDYIVTVKVESPRKGRKPRIYTKDIIVPARKGTRKDELLWLIQKYRPQLPQNDREKAGLVFNPKAEITIAEGPRTRGKKPQLR